MGDTITELCGATVQHGPLNRRIYLMSMNEASPNRLLDALDQLATASEYTKIFAKVPASASRAFVSAGYVQEATVPGYFGGMEDACFVCKYLDDSRKVEPNLEAILKTVESAQSSSAKNAKDEDGPRAVSLRRCEPEDVSAMAALYGSVFQSYPFPIDDPAYLATTMQSHVFYYCVEKEGQMIALSSAETDPKNRAVEMTDFATHPAHRGQGTATLLLSEMEKDMRAQNMAALYTIARAGSPAINRLFGASGYAFGGVLINNTHIGGQLESMTVWHKLLK